MVVVLAPSSVGPEQADTAVGWQGEGGCHGQLASKNDPEKKVANKK